MGQPGTGTGTRLDLAGPKGQARFQADVLARRNVELELLGEMAGALQKLETEESILEVSLELLMLRLELSAGWVFLTDEGSERLRLAASRGVAERHLSGPQRHGTRGCLCFEVFDAGRGKAAHNLADCPVMRQILPGGGEIVHACIPLKFEHGVLGILNLANRPGVPFSAQELGFLETAGRQISLAVDRARSARAERRHNAETQALVSLARALGGSLNQQTVLEAIAPCARELLAATRCAIFLGDGTSPFVFASLSGPPIEGLEVGGTVEPEALGFPLFGPALRARRAVAIAGAQDHPNFLRDVARRWGIESVIVAPLFAHQRLEGLMLADRETPSHWQDLEIDMADGLAGQAAIAIENARLYHEARESLLKLQEAQYGMMRAERMAAVGMLASCLAHEVRNPLNSINLRLVLLDRRVAKLPDGLREELNALIEGARGEITRLDGMVEEFLSLSTIDHLSLEAADPDEVLREVETLMSPVALERNITLSSQSQGPVAPVPMDREKIKQVLLNLIRNAMEAMPQGGSIVLSTHEKGSCVCLNVTDTGPGVKPGLELFDFFVTTKRGGTGLGLPIARRIVEVHGGTLTCANGPERGATFTVRLKRK